LFRLLWTFNPFQELSEPHDHEEKEEEK